MKHLVTQQRKLNEKELLDLAAVWQNDMVGRHRNKDGTLPGWHKWARQHSQREDEIIICQGRNEWQREISIVAESTAKQNLNLSIVSWNILSETWLRIGFYNGGYTHVKTEVGEWSYRRQLLLEWIERLNPGVLTLQEVDYDIFHVELQDELRKRGYDGLIQKPRNQSKGQPCGNATFWKNRKFQLVQQKPFSRTFCVVLGFLNRQNQSLPEDCQNICIANAHLESSQNDAGADRRARQLNSALSYAATEAPDAALIVCGDYNTGADSELFHVLRKHQWHGHAFSSVYEHPSTANTLPVSKATFMVPGHHYVIDHILYAQDTLRLRCVLDAFSQQEMEEHIHPKGEECGFPSSFCPSDHLPVGAIFEILPQRMSKGTPACRDEDEQATLSEERERELSQQWKTLQAQYPTQVKGKPSPEQLDERKKYASTVKAWKASVNDNPAELAFVTKLIKTKK